MPRPICPTCRRIEVLKPGWWCTNCELQWLWEHGMYWSHNARYPTEAEKAERTEFTER